MEGLSSLNLQLVTFSELDELSMIDKIGILNKKGI